LIAVRHASSFVRVIQRTMPLFSRLTRHAGDTTAYGGEGAILLVTKNRIPWNCWRFYLGLI